jgi:NTP pyrophosphatase (non-canonical NTP hydrolase)
MTAFFRSHQFSDSRRDSFWIIGKRDWEQYHSPKNLAMALSVEVAEIVEHFQWLTGEQSQDLPPEKLAEIREGIGDVMIYLIELAGLPHRQQTRFAEYALNLLVRLLRNGQCRPTHRWGDGDAELVHR